MWNYNYSVPTFLVLMVITGYYLIRPKMRVRSNITFRHLLEAMVCTMVSDYVSIHLDMHPDRYGVAALYLANMAFFWCYVHRSWLFLCFARDELMVRISPVERIASLAVYFGCMALIAVSPWTGLWFSIDREGYHAGPWYSLMTWHFVFFILLSLSLLPRARRRTRRKHTDNILVYNLVLLVGIVCRFLFPHMVIMNLFCLLAIIIIFLSFQNPDFHIEPKTGLFDNEVFERVIDESIMLRRSWSLLLFSIDDYIGERMLYGPGRMDEALSAIAAWMKNRIRGCSLYYLRNGDFVVASPWDADVQTARTALMDRFRTPFAGLYLHASFCATSSSIPYADAAQVLEYVSIVVGKQAKSDEEACFTIDQDHLAAIQRVQKVKAALENAIWCDKVELYVQPIVNAKTMRLEGAEALARIEDPELGVIGPDEFMPIAEKSGMVVGLGRQMLVKACRFMAEYGGAVSLQWINVNLSPVQCLRHDLATDFGRIIEASGMDPARIHLEITEQTVVDADLFRGQMYELEEKGFRFVLDDFGSGYSNLRRLNRAHFIGIKLDKEYVWESVRNPSPLLSHIVRGMEELGIPVTAEGVEDEHMARTLAAMGCSYLQGFLFSRPVPAREFVAKYRTDGLSS